MIPVPDQFPIAPFEFAADFSGSTAGSGSISQAARARADELRDYEAAAYARGYSDGMSIESAGTVAKLVQTLEQISGQIDALETAVACHNTAAQVAAGKLAFAFARKLAGKLVETDPVAPIAEGFGSLLTDLVGVPDVTISVHPDLVADVNLRVTELAKGRLTGCTLHIVEDAALMPGDCRIDWENGGLVRDHAMFEARLAALLERSQPATTQGKAP